MGTSGRRFDVDTSIQPVVQFVVSTLPFLVLLLWFLWTAHKRPNINCYVNADEVNDDVSASALDEECSQYVPLKQIVWIFLSLELLWGLLAGYLTYYIPRRHSLVEEFLTRGETVIGDVYYTNRKRWIPCVGLTSYGTVVYRHPLDATALLQRKVRIFERYTRERAAIVVLPDYPYSGQPKVDLEIDREVVAINKRRRQMLTYFAWIWFAFCLLAPTYVVHILQRLDSGFESPWQPDIDISNFPTLFYVLAFAVIPVVCLVWNVVASLIHNRWMKTQHRAIEEGEFVNEPDMSGCCFDDADCESIEVPKYHPPTAQSLGASRQGEVV